MYWLAAPFARLVPGEPGMRLGPALCSVATLAVVHGSMRRHTGRADVAWASTLALAGAPLFPVFSRALLSDPPLTLVVTVAMSGVLRLQSERRGWRTLGAGLGAAVACKSLAAAVPAVAMLPWLWRPARDALGERTGRRALVHGAALLVGLGAPLYGLGFFLHGRRYGEEHVELNLWQRASQGFEGIGLGADPWAHLRALPEFDGPWVPALLLGGSLSMSTKLPHYLLVLYPCAAMAGGALYSEWTRHRALATRLYGPLLAPAEAALCSLSASDYSGGMEHLLPLPFGRALAAICGGRVPARCPCRVRRRYPQ